MLSRFSVLVPCIRGLFLATAFLLASLSMVLAQAPERPVVGTPWDDEFSIQTLVIRTGEYTGSIVVISPGSAVGEPTFSCAGLPPGLKLNKATGEITGTTAQPGYYSITASVIIGGLRSLPVTRRIAVVPPHVPIPGIYEDVLPIEVIRPMGGHVMVNLTPSGAYTGRVRVGHRTISLAGVFRHIPGAPPDTGLATSTFPLQGTEGQPLIGTLLSGPEHDGVILEVRALGDEQGLYAGAAMQRMRPTLGYIPPMQPVGRHVVGFHSEAGLNLGAGFGSIVITKDGLLSFVGQTGEGRGITGSHWCLPIDEIALGFVYFSDNVSTALLGALQISAEKKGVSPALAWMRLPQRGRLYPEGIEEYVEVYASRWDASAVARAFPLSTALFRISIPDSPELVETEFRVTPRFRTVFGTGEANPYNVRLDIYAPTGLYSGRFTVRSPDPRNPERTLTRTVSYRGILLPDHDRGMGNFIIPTLPDSESPPTASLATTPLISALAEVFGILVATP